ncbi:ASCH domain-containing protein [Enterobacter hormaechei subsp. xiangfangensis]|jgi:hypothetical protein|uniref:ASCH domain-containing protein n=1 Tax=Enterobacter hormaechei TaxID=158836 RepID=UPI000F83316A|nr:ASCH domain-containing protein [Enterobacter hormaechei]RTM58768.1 ASCH domain-containing protein [Enterobacter hormaechei subsp. xiangfangensis]
MSDLQLAVKGVYFDAMQTGEKVEEYRLVSPYWINRLMSGFKQRNYDHLIITRGYPKRDDLSKRIVVPYNGYEIKVITHEHFGPDPVKVFAIKVNLQP